MQKALETRVRALGRENPKEGKEGKAIHSSIFAWRIPWTEEPAGLQSTGSQNQTRLKQLGMRAKQKEAYCTLMDQMKQPEYKSS